MKIGKNNLDIKYRHFIINGKYFVIDVVRGHPVPKEISKKEFDTKVKKVEKMAKLLEEGLDKKAVLMESIMKLDDENFKVFEGILLKSKINYKPRTREHHCVDIKIGNFILPLSCD